MHRNKLSCSVINLCGFNFTDPIPNYSQSAKENENPNSRIESCDEVANVDTEFKNLFTQSTQQQKASTNKIPDGIYEKEKAECIEYFHTVSNNIKEKFVRCKVCLALPNIVKLNSSNRKVAPITTSAGTRNRRDCIEDHFLSRFHISADNLLKTFSRNSVSLETENKYLYVHFNMPTLELWNPREAINMWMGDKKRKDHSNVIEKSAKNAPYYKSIFEDAKQERKTIEISKENVKKF